MNDPTSGPRTFAQVIGHLKTVADRWERGEATKQEIADALVQLEGAKRVVSDYRAEQAQADEVSE